MLSKHFSEYFRAHWACFVVIIFPLDLVVLLRSGSWAQRYFNCIYSTPLLSFPIHWQPSRGCALAHNNNKSSGWLEGYQKISAWPEKTLCNPEDRQYLTLYQPPPSPPTPCPPQAALLPPRPSAVLGLVCTAPGAPLDPTRPKSAWCPPWSDSTWRDPGAALSPRPPGAPWDAAAAASASTRGPSPTNQRAGA